MKIVFTGGGTGGHFYPIIAIAEAIRAEARERDLLDPELYFVSSKPFDAQALFANGIAFIQCPAGKVRRYFSLANISDLFVTVWGTLRAIGILFSIYPDVVFSKGGYASVPTILAAHFLRIPIVIHESDAKPGRANILAARYAYRIGVAFDSVAEYLPLKSRPNIARVGIPVRAALVHPEVEGAKQLLGLDPELPTVLILGGSLGSSRINDMVIGGLNELMAIANVIHQTGKDNFKEVEAESSVILEKSEHKNRYHAFPYLSAESLRQAASAADIIVSRAGSSTINEISLWSKPAILIPIPESVSHDQRTNAYAYARTGAAVVLEEENMSPHVLVSEVHRILTTPGVAESMAQHSSSFANPDAARSIADELITIGLSHDPDNKDIMKSV
ncbi:MAG: UDP-N-acetylglucosamine--N-acetylmuramyl-(pentapeptide) pyrophosphoryl-undecaprenol N-acetylglucosamine transferase [Candidatus Pacebacteria bacterium]|nr:UDP-N-acetylglucosamine--N-acetylmuramyl-(pentapeptide) pyrophosphoryl-undecaprenol N-acetylglucosamine transferase [Candidatus Paceibacterota bacterium]